MTYEYECTGCNHLWEAEQRISEDPLKECPQCKKEMAKRLISKSSFSLKGGGWADTGYSS